MNDYHFFFSVINTKYCDFVFETQNDLLETMIHVRMSYVNKCAAFCKTYQYSLLNFPLLFDTGGIKQSNRTKNCLVVGVLETPSFLRAGMHGCFCVLFAFSVHPVASH